MRSSGIDYTSFQPYQVYPESPFAHQLIRKKAYTQLAAQTILESIQKLLLLQKAVLVLIIVIFPSNLLHKQYVSHTGLDLALPVTSCITLAMLFNISEPDFIICKIIDNNAYCLQLYKY